MKQYELEFSVDPLFKKTSAEFDEGGASGLLLNHLQIDKGGRIIFDSSDAILESKSAAKGPTGAEKVEEEPLKDTNIAMTAFSPGFLASLQDIWSKEICPSFRSFEFNRPGEFVIPTLPGNASSLPVPFNSGTECSCIFLIQMMPSLICLGTGGHPPRVRARLTTSFMPFWAVTAEEQMTTMTLRMITMITAMLVTMEVIWTSTVITPGPRAKEGTRLPHLFVPSRPF